MEGGGWRERGGREVDDGEKDLQNWRLVTFSVFWMMSPLILLVPSTSITCSNTRLILATRWLWEEGGGGEKEEEKERWEER